MNEDYEVELRLQLKRSPAPVHIIYTSPGFIIARGYPYHGDRFIRVPEEMEEAILNLCADPTLSIG